MGQGKGAQEVAACLAVVPARCALSLPLSLYRLRIAKQLSIEIYAC